METLSLAKMTTDLKISGYAGPRLGKLFARHLLIVIVGLYLLATGAFRVLYRLVVVWFHRGTTEDDGPN
jgi:hypothetical protein